MKELNVERQGNSSILVESLNFLVESLNFDMF